MIMVLRCDDKHQLEWHGILMANDTHYAYMWNPPPLMSKLKQGFKFLSISFLLAMFIRVVYETLILIRFICSLMRYYRQDQTFILIKVQCFITFCYIGTIFVALDNFNVFEQMPDVLAYKDQFIYCHKTSFDTLAIAHTSKRYSSHDVAHC